MKLSIATVALLATAAPLFASASNHKDVRNPAKYLRALKKNDADGKNIVGEVSSSNVAENEPSASSAGLRSLETSTIADLALATPDLSILVSILPDDLIQALSDASAELTVSFFSFRVNRLENRVTH